LISGCTDVTALNYNPNACHDDGGCLYPLKGCTDPTATNYNPLATLDDGSCTYAPNHPFCSILVKTNTQFVLQYDIITNTTTSLGSTGFSSLDCAHTIEKYVELTSYSNCSTPFMTMCLKIYNITFSPILLTFDSSLSLETTSPGGGLVRIFGSNANCFKDANTIITQGTDADFNVTPFTFTNTILYEIDITQTTNPISAVAKFPLISNPEGDFIYDKDLDVLYCVEQGNTLRKYDYSTGGVLAAYTDVIYDYGYGIILHNNYIYVAIASGTLIEVNKATLIPTGNTIIMDGFIDDGGSYSLTGMSQVLNCI
jgi:hypothetical protein